MRRANYTLQKRLGLYLLLAVLVVASPFLIMHVMLMIIGPRETGLGYGVFPGLLLAQFAFGLIFIRKATAPRLTWILMGTLLTCGLSWAGVMLSASISGWDAYGYWELVLTSLIASSISWELVYQVSSRYMKPTS
ncbi:MAG: hypothetical protein IPI55_02125 [Flavobacteriales bacterium]|nr:hypothetical protein [Flavobacteriales bacterium]